MPILRRASVTRREEWGRIVAVRLRVRGDAMNGANVCDESRSGEMPRVTSGGRAGSQPRLARQWSMMIIGSSVAGEPAPFLAITEYL